MSSLFSCPKCQRPIGEIPPSGSLETICVGCKYKFRVIQGRLADKSSTQVAPQGQFRRAGFFARGYELRVELATRQLEIIRFQTDGIDDRILVQRGDIVAIVHSMRNSALEELLSIQNLTTNETFELSEPGARARSSSTIGSVVIALVTGFVVMVAGAGGAIGLISAAIGGIASRMALKRMLSPVHRLAPQRQAELSASQHLLSEKVKLVDARNAHADALRGKQDLRQRLSALRKKMEDVGLPAYQPRIASIDTALATLDKQMAMDARLRDGYDKSIKMIEIELESGTAMDQLNDDITNTIMAAVDELHAIEASQAELGRQLEANVEVEQLLRLRAE